MGKKKKKDQTRNEFIKTGTVTISAVDLMRNSAGSVNKSMGIVSSGTGAHKNKKAYCRKDKHKQKY